jgi:hypothetical protein
MIQGVFVYWRTSDFTSILRLAWMMLEQSEQVMEKDVVESEGLLLSTFERLWRML